MQVQRQLLAGAVLSALAAMSCQAHAQTATPLATPSADADQTLREVVVTASPFQSDENAQVLTPAKVLAGDELREKLGNSLGATLSQELGVSASAFGAGASRPIIRGLEGPRVKVLQNGMSVSDVSSLSNDHAVASEGATARQIEILRGPAALLYGSGAIGGVVNVVNDRIPSLLLPRPAGSAEVRYSTVDQGQSLTAEGDAAVGAIGLHVDGNWRQTGDYAIPGRAAQSDPAAGNGRLDNSFTRAQSVGFGASYIASWGHIGASVGTIEDHYGIPTAEKSTIDLDQTRYDLDALINDPFAGISSLRFRIGVTDYKHTERESDGTADTVFANDAVETRLELTHAPLAGWLGSFGVQTETSKFSGLSAQTGLASTVPQTKSSTIAAFLVEQRQFGPVLGSAGLRLESVQRRPDGGQPDRNFDLFSYSVGAMWAFTPGYGLGATWSLAQRAPATEELYSNGPHESTATYDIGSNALQKETSRNIELTLQKTEGLVRWKTNLFQNQVANYIFGMTGSHVDGSGVVDADGEFLLRNWSQARATIRGAEAEISYNQSGQGMSGRLFADTSRGKLDDLGNLPLQPATRYGVDLGYRYGGWRSGVSVIHALQQDRLASFETFVTPSYTWVDANLSYTQHIGAARLTWFALLKNLLNQDVRYSTSVLKDVAPLQGRNLVVGMRTQF